MFPLFKIRKQLSLAKPGKAAGIKIKISACAEHNGRCILALFCSNGYLLFMYQRSDRTQPVVRQVPWFYTAGKEIKAMSFDPSGIWLLLVTVDASIFILPVLPLLDESIKIPNHWKCDNITEIKLSGQRASLTSVRWWQTLQGQHIAVIGSELGEIAFINLVNKKEIGGTYITMGISALDILKDESRDTTYLLITSNNQQQWRLLLEEKKSNFYWPYNSEAEVLTCDTTKGTASSERLSKELKEYDQKPHNLSKFESGTFLTPQLSRGRSLVSAYNSSSCLLQVLEGDLNQMNLFSYHVPSDCENVILSEKLIFVTQFCLSSSEKQQSCLKILSRKFSEICSENMKKKELQNSEIQSFLLDNKILAVYKKSFSGTKDVSLKYSSPDEGHKLYSDTDFKQRHSLHCFVDGGNGVPVGGYAHNFCTDSEEYFNVKEAQCAADFLSSTSSLEGYFAVQGHTVWESQLRLAPEVAFLTLTTIPTDLPSAEKLGIMLGLDIQKLYEVAAEMQLAHGKFTQAVHLYQLSKCPQLKRIAHFMSYGYLSELIAYIQVLFSTKSTEIVSADKCHFANIALHCFAQQTMEKIQERPSISIAFKKFLRDNIYYDEAVAVKLLAEQGLYDLLNYFTEVRGQHGLVVETLLFSDGTKETVDRETYDTLSRTNYDKLVLHFQNDDYMLCITSHSLLQYLVERPRLLSRHLEHLIGLLPKMNIHELNRIASLYDVSRSVTKLALRNSAVAKQRHRYWSANSALSIPTEEMDFVQTDDSSANEDDIVKFFIFVLLMLCHQIKRHNFNPELLSCDLPKCTEKKRSEENSVTEIGNLTLSSMNVQVACGLSHVAYCRNGVLFTWGKEVGGKIGIISGANAELHIPRPVNTFMRLGVKVMSVSCGAAHTLALTDFGVFSWGLSRFGQLGLGEVQHSDQPIIVESLEQEYITAVHCGQYHSLALTKDGRVYSWGWGVHGQLGHGNPEDVSIPQVIAYLKSRVVIALGAGQGHSIVLTETGEVYAFGCGMFGQLGIGSVTKQSLPQLVPLPETVSLIASGHFHTVAVSKENNVYVWGCNPQALRLQAQCSRRARQNSNLQNSVAATQASHSALHSSDSMSSSLKSSQPNALQQTHLLPKLIDSSLVVAPVAQVSCGNHHSVMVTTAGRLFAWGRNMEGQLGTGNHREQKTPVLVEHLGDHELIHAACGTDFTVAVDASGRIWGWGKNDCGQVGQKPSETNTRVASGPTSGRVITIRTNRRMITITQPCRQSLPRPVEIAIPKDEIPVGDFDSGSFENEHPVPLFSSHFIDCGGIQDISHLSSYDNPSYGPYALHAALKAFHSYCDLTILLNHCLKFSNYQAAAKICLLQNLYAEALEYQFRAITMDSNIPQKDYLSLAIYVIDSYMNNVDPEDIKQNQQFVIYVIEFWIFHDLPVQPLEFLFHRNLSLLSYPLGLLLFSRTGFDDAVKSAAEKFLKLLSPPFCLSLTSAVISKVQSNCSNFELIEMISANEATCALEQIHASDAFTAWTNSVTSERLWQEILHGFQKGIISHSALYLSAGDVDVLLKSIMAEKLCNYRLPVNDIKSTDLNDDAVIFSCNHHFTLESFLTSVLPGFEHSMQKFQCNVPVTLKLVLQCYETERVIPLACPRCVINEVKTET